MTDVLTASLHTPRGRSDDTLVVDALEDYLQHHACNRTDDTPCTVFLLRGFGGAARARAARLRRRIDRRLPDVRVTTVAAPVVDDLTRALTECCAALDVGDRATDAATLGWRWTANQPERGRLGIRCDLGEELLLAPGATLVVAAPSGAPGADPVAIHDGTLRIRVAVGDREDVTTSAHVVEVREIDGPHFLWRDGVVTGDAPDLVRIAAREGVARRVS